MPSQFFGLNVAYKGLLASNAALNTTNNNIANVETTGYSRQQVKQVAAKSLRVHQTYGSIGAGVDTVAIEQVRDLFYDGKFWNNRDRLGEYEAKNYYMKQLEAYVQDNGQNAGFKTVFDRLAVTALQEWQKNPGDISAKAQFVSTAGDLAKYFNGLYGNLAKMQKDLNQEIKLKVDEINSLAGEIATLNKQINIIELGGGRANELRDRRSVLLDDLSKIVDMDTEEQPLYDVNNPERKTGGHRFIVKIAAGQVLVDGSEFHGLECIARTNQEAVNQSDIDGLYDVYWRDESATGTPKEQKQKFYLYNAALGGYLQGLVEMRDGNNGENFQGVARSVGSKTVGGVAYDTVTIEVSAEHLQDLNKSKLSGKGIVNVANKEYKYTDWTFEKVGGVYQYTFTLATSSDASLPLLVAQQPEAKTGASIAFQGIPYYMAQMNEWVRVFAGRVNGVLTQGYNGIDNRGVNLYSAINPVTGQDYTFAADMSGTGGPVANGDDSYYHLTAENLITLTALEKDPSLLASRFRKEDGQEQSDLIRDLKKLFYDKDRLSFRGSNASEFLQMVLSDVALGSNRVETLHSTFQGIEKAIDNQRISVSGVDSDEETLNLVKYQRGYNLASKMIQTLTEIYDRLILETGV